MNKIKNFFFSTRLTAILFFVFATTMGIATFIENDYGTQSSKALVYNAWWFELIMLIFVVNFAGNIFRYNLLRKEKLSVLVFHLSFVLIIIGAGITRYISFEGKMPIKEGESTNLMLSEKTFLNVYIDNGVDEAREIAKQYYFTPEISSEFRFIPVVSRFFNFLRGGNDFSLNSNFREKPITINYIDYLPNAYEKFETDASGEEFLHFVESSSGSRHDHYIKKGELSNIHNILVAYEKYTEGAINIYTENDSLKIKSPFEGDYMIMATKAQGKVAKDSSQVFNLRSLYTLGEMKFVVPEIAKGNLVLTSGDKEEHREDRLEVEVVTENAKKKVVLYGSQFSINPSNKFTLDGFNFRLSYGAKQLELPFSIKLRDFQLDRYPGSNSPKSFASEVTVLDNGENFDFRIYMNHILDHKGYRFFQSSYNITETYEETHLSVNHDRVGTWITYLGYGLLFLGLLITLMVKNTRFSSLGKQLNKIKKKKAALFLIALLSLSSFAQETEHKHQAQINITNLQIDSILNAQKATVEHAERFGKLVIQDAGGRMKPLNTFASELLRKVSHKDTYNEMDANQVVVSLVTNPRLWFSVPFIYMITENTKVRDLLGIPNDQKYARLSDLFTDKGEYKLSEVVDKAHKKIIKSKFEQSVLNIDERVNLLYQAITGSIFKFFPLQDDENNKWYSYTEQNEFFKGKDSLNAAYLLPVYSEALFKAVKSKDYTKADEYLEMIHKFQRKVGGEVMPSEEKVKLELFYNKYDIFKGLFWKYMLASLLLFIVVVVQIFKKSKIIEFLVKAVSVVIVLLFIYHTIGLGVRWYISGHAPWSNGYESMIYISWATMLFGMILGRKSALTLAATTFVVSMILMIAHWNWMDPSIGNLVPVLDSYWLMIHVSIIVGSYGPFTLSMILGVLVLLLYVFTTSKNKERLDLVIKEITIISEMSIMIGLVMLTIGNFLGGMWANESWGRYWGWDPKETWALINIMIYAFILHMRLIPGLRGRFTFNIMSVFAFASILMGYLGVNHLLSGLHSYAAGDAVPIPNEIWGWLLTCVVLSILAFFKYRKYYKK